MRIGVDLGGTNVRAGLVKDGHIVRLLSEPCKADRPEGEVVDHIASLIGELMRPEVSRIGIGVPSVVDAARGIVYNVVGIPSWREVYLKDLLEKRFSVPVHVNNDCNCFALGVCRFGEASAFSDVVCVALGTGVGAGVVIGGKLYCGRDTGAGEIGSIPYLDRDYEYYCSSRFFVGRGRECKTRKKTSRGARAFSAPTNRVPRRLRKEAPGRRKPRTAPRIRPIRIRLTRLSWFHLQSSSMKRFLSGQRPGNGGCSAGRGHLSVRTKRSKKDTLRSVSFFLERVTGLEPATSTLARWRSTR